MRSRMHFKWGLQIHRSNLNSVICDYNSLQTGTKAFSGQADCTKYAWAAHLVYVPVA